MKRIVIGAGTVGATGVALGALGLFGAGTAAAAPDVVDMLYEDAVSEIEADGGTPVVAVRIGDRMDSMGDCLVTNATDAPFMRDVGDAFEHADGEVLLTLNCNRGAATATTPGSSMGSQSGREFQARAEEAAAEAEQEQLEEVSTPDE